MTRAVSRRTGALNGLLAIVGRVSTKGTLVNGAVRIAVKRHAHVLQIVDCVGRFATHEFNRVLVAKPIGALDGVVKVIVPIVFRHIAQ